MFTQTELDAFVANLTQSQINRLMADGMDCPANLAQAVARTTDGRKYVGVNIGSGRRYFIDKQDGTIYPCASYRKPNVKRSFGTLATWRDFDWGAYEAKAKPGTPWVMKTLQHYQTAVPA